jgi:hypothetical protein
VLLVVLVLVVVVLVVVVEEPGLPWSIHSRVACGMGQ